MVVEEVVGMRGFWKMGLRLMSGGRSAGIVVCGGFFEGDWRGWVDGPMAGSGGRGEPMVKPKMCPCGLRVVVLTQCV